MVDQPLPLPANPWPALGGVTSALAMFGVAQGLSYPLFALLMQRQGMSPAEIGLSAAMMPLGLTLCSPFVPTLVRWFGARGLGVGCALLAAACFLAIALLQNWIAWYPLRFLVGLLINPLYVLGEVWALTLAPPGQRGRVMGIFNSVMGLGYAIGPMTLAVVGVEGLAPFSVAIAGFLCCGLILFMVTRGLGGFEDNDDPSASVTRFARVAPALLLAVGVAAAVGQSSYALLPLYGAAQGLADTAAAALLTAFSFGNILLQIPLGFAAERFGARFMILFCAATTLVGTLLLPVLFETVFLWPLLVVMGGIGYGIYTMSTVEMGNRFHGQMLVAGNAAFALLWGAGGIVGPPISGGVMQIVGPGGYLGAVVSFCLILIVFMGYRTWHRTRQAAPPA